MVLLARPAAIAFKCSHWFHKSTVPLHPKYVTATGMDKASFALSRNPPLILSTTDRIKFAREAQSAIAQWILLRWRETESSPPARLQELHRRSHSKLDNRCRKRLPDIGQDDRHIVMLLHRTGREVDFDTKVFPVTWCFSTRGRTLSQRPSRSIRNPKIILHSRFDTRTQS